MNGKCDPSLRVLSTIRHPKYRSNYFAHSRAYAPATRASSHSSGVRQGCSRIMTDTFSQALIVSQSACSSPESGALGYLPWTSTLEQLHFLLAGRHTSPIMYHQPIHIYALHSRMIIASTSTPSCGPSSLSLICGPECTLNVIIGEYDDGHRWKGCDRA